MNERIKDLFVVFAAGCAGGLANSIVAWFFGYAGISSALGVNIAPALTPAWLYPRIVWGGIWGALFLLPLLPQKFFSRTFLFSLGPTAVQLLIVFPLKANKGVMGLDLGALTPALVVFFNFIWGLKAAVLLRMAKQ